MMRMLLSPHRYHPAFVMSRFLLRGGGVSRYRGCLSSMATSLTSVQQRCYVTDVMSSEGEHSALAAEKKDVFDRPPQLQFEIPQRLRQKVVCLDDAVSLIRDGDTISVSGFVAQGNSL